MVSATHSGSRYRSLGWPPNKSGEPSDKWFAGKATCILIGNIGRLIGSIAAFPDARPDDAVLEIGIFTANGAWQWSKTLARTAVGKADTSPFVATARGTKFDIRFAKAIPYELDGGDRKKSKRLKIKIQPAAITFCVPNPAHTDQ